MKDVLKSQLFQLKNERLVQIIFLFLMFFAPYAFWMMIYPGISDYSILKGGYSLILSGSMICLPSNFFVMAVVPILMGKDYSGNMIHCDLLCGHSRKEVFFGRAVVTTAVAVVGALMIIVSPIIVLTVKYGWGDSLPLMVYLSRLALYALFVVRLSSELILLTVICRKIYVSYIVTILMYIMEERFLRAYEIYLPKIFSTEIGFSIMNFKARAIHHINRDLELIYDNGTFSGDMIFITVSSVIILLACISVAYMIFKHDDM